MRQEIERNCSQTIATVAAAGNLSAAIDMRGFAGGIILAPVLTAASVIGFKVCDTATGTFLPLYDKTGALVNIVADVATAKAYPLPDELYGAAFFKVWTCTAAGADNAQAAARTFRLSMKG